MKKSFYIIGVLLAAAVCVLTLYSGISRAGVVGSKHDMGASWKTPSPGSQFTFETTQVCVFCHTPHGANRDIGERTYIVTGAGLDYQQKGQTNPVLLWNRAFANNADGPGNPGYKTYDSSTMNADVSQVRAYSLMCMSCHDGLSAMNVMQNPPEVSDDFDAYDANGYPKPEGSIVMKDAVLVGEPPPSLGDRFVDTDAVDLSNDHPISFDYDDQLYLDHGGATGGLRQPSEGYVSYSGITLRLFPNDNGQWVSMECSTCHDPHNYGDLAAKTQPFLVATKADSKLCTVCHNK